MNQPSPIEWHEPSTEDHDGSFFSAEQTADGEWQLTRRFESEVCWYLEKLTDTYRKKIEFYMQAQQGQCIQAMGSHCCDLASKKQFWTNSSD